MDGRRELHTLHGSQSALPICRWAEQGQSQSRPCSGKLSRDWSHILVRSGFWLSAPHPHLSLSSLLSFSEWPLAPGPLGCLLQLVPITVPDHSPGPCGDKVPWAPRRGECRAVCRSAREGGWCQAELVWPVFSPSRWPLEALGVLSGPRWGAREGCVVSSLPCPGPTSQLDLTWLSGTLSLTTSQGRKTSGMVGVSL